jgi:enoyl-CoA hydratase/carnithine racemase
VASLPLSKNKVIAEIDGPIGWIVFNNPARRNAVSLEMWQAVPEIFDRFEAEAAVRVIVLRGAGDKAFVSGLDISQFADEFSSSQAAARLDALSATANRRIRKSPKPTIAMIGGYCIGAGVQIAVNCDLRIAAASATLAITAARLGLGYPVGSLKRLLDLVGPSFAKEIFFTARQFSAAEAERMGLVNRVVPASELESTVRSYGETIAANAPLTIGAIKQSIETLQSRLSDSDFAACERLMKACLDSADYAEGRRAFAEKRKPVFTGR